MDVRRYQFLVCTNVLRSALLVYLVLHPAKAWPSDNLTAQDRQVISNLRSAISGFDNVEFNASAIRRSSGSDGTSDGATIVEEQSIVFRRVGSRVLRSIKAKYVNPKKESLSYWQSDATVNGNGDVLNFYTPLDSSYRQIPVDQNRLHVMLYSRRLAGIQEQDRETICKLPVEFGVIVWTIGNISLSEFIDNASELTVSRDEVGADIRIRSEFGDLGVSLSSKFGWLPQSFKLVQKAKHMAGDGPLGEIFARESIEFESKVWEGDVGGFAISDNGKWYAKEFQLTCRSTFRNRPAGLISIETKVERLVFSPELNDEDFLSNIEVPKGRTVTVAGASHLPYIWDGNTAVPGIPELPSKVAEATSHSAGQMRVFLLVANVIVLLGLVLLIVRQRRTAG